jgi:integrase
MPSSKETIDRDRTSTNAGHTSITFHTGHLEDRHAFVFGTPDGEHLDYSNWLHRIWYPARAKAGLDWLQFHDLRRANATGLVLEGIDLKTAQTRLGHTDPRLTLGIYAQATTEADRQAADRLGERFLPRPDQGRGRSLA